MYRSRPDRRRVMLEACQRSPAREAGLTLMEMVVFIVILGVLSVAVVATFTTPLTGAGARERAVYVTQLAQERLEVVLGQKRREGFPGSDPCAGGASLATCNVPAGFSINTSFGAWSVDPDTDNYQVITVSVAGPSGVAYSTHALVSKLGGG